MRLAFASAETRRGRLRAVASPPVLAPELGPGVHAFPVGDGQEAELLVPRDDDPRRPAPLIVMLHGAGGRASQVLPILAAQAEQQKMLVLAPNARSSTWDLIRGGYGADVALIDEALSWIFARYAVEPRRLAIGGFSDGASYALSLGLTNGDLFGDILAFSPGFAAPGGQTGKPRIFISHGRQDEVLPIERCGRPLSRRLADAGYDVDYREFQDGHIVPPNLVEEAVARFLDGPP